jgi:hypothetical protein
LFDPVLDCVEKFVRHVPHVLVTLGLELLAFAAVQSWQRIQRKLRASLVPVAIATKTTCERFGAMSARGDFGFLRACGNPLSVGNPLPHLVATGKRFFREVHFMEQPSVVTISLIDKSIVDVGQGNGRQAHAG